MLVFLGIILIVGGAILAWAVDAAVEGLDLLAIGYILMAGGVVALIAAAIRGAGWMSMSNRHMKHERYVSPDGTHMVDETHTA